VLVFLPQQSILFTSAVLPARATKQQLNAIAYSIEEVVGQDIESCFVAITAQQPNREVPVAVIDHQIMDNCTDLLSRQHVSARYILPQLYLCPWTGDKEVIASICPFQEGYLIRYGLHAGLFCDASILEQIVTQLTAQKKSEQNRLEVYTDHALLEWPGDDDKVQVNRHATLHLLAQPLAPQLCINLKQKEYQSSNQWLSLLKKWRWPIVAMIVWFVLIISSNLIGVWQKQQVLDDLIVRQQSLLSEHLPQLELTSQPKRQLVKVLTESQGADGKVGFLDLLHEYSQLKARFSSVSTERLQYQQSRLIINLETSDLKSLESFRAGLEKSPYQAEIENVSINPDKTTGRLVMQEK